MANGVPGAGRGAAGGRSRLAAGSHGGAHWGRGGEKGTLRHFAHGLRHVRDFCLESAQPFEKS
jgi:hypothetical protein